MAVDVSNLVAALRGVAAMCDGSATFPVVLRMSVGPATFTIRAAGTAEALEARARLLERQARRSYTTRGSAVCRPTQQKFSQAGYSAAVAQRFIDDGEVDNWRAYCELTGRPHPAGGPYK